MKLLILLAFVLTTLVSCNDKEEELTHEQIEERLSVLLQTHLGITSSDELYSCNQNSECSLFSIPNIKYPVSGYGCARAYNESFESKVLEYRNNDKVRELRKKFSNLKVDRLALSYIDCINAVGAKCENQRCESIYVDGIE